MNNVFILNASPLISLGKASLLKTIAPLGRSWIVPEGVVSEVEIKGTIDPYLDDLAAASDVSRKTVKQVHPTVEVWDIGRGEGEVITLAMQNKDTKVVLDDLQARKCAELMNIPMIGSLGLLIMAKQNGLIDKVRPEIEKLVAAGLYIDSGVLGKVYLKIDETN